MKCPKCGYVSFPDLLECKNCGYHFAQPKDAVNPRSLDSVLLQDRSPAGQASPSPRLETGMETSPNLPSEASLRSGREVWDKRDEKTSPLQQSLSRQANAFETGGGHDLSERVASYRRRRSEQESLQFDFGSEPDTERPMPATSQGRSRSVSNAAGTLDKAFDEQATRLGQINLESIPVETRRSDFPSRFRRSQGSTTRSDGAARLETTPIDSIDASLAADSRFQDSSYPEVVCAPIGKRFAAGIIDAFLLALAGCLFALLFTLVGGSIQMTSMGLIVIAFLAVFWIFAYFALFTAMSFGTPGQAAMGLSVRTLEGNLPTLQEALLRAFGYLVSLGSLMLGFLWAVMDSDGLAWHDHISGTLLVED